MPGALKTWPSWPEYTMAKSEPDPDGSLLRYKQEIVAQYGEAALRTSWLKVCAELERITDGIASQGTTAIPEVEYGELMAMSGKEKENLMEKGCFVVRDVVEKEVANGWFGDLKRYVRENKERVGGWPSETPFVLRLYWSPTQLAIRSHPHHLRLQEELNSWWHSDPSDPHTSPEPLSYADAVRIRPPGIPFYGLGPHIDAGSLSRWADPAYRKVYEKIWSGQPEQHDCYNLETRKDARQAFFSGQGHSSVLRSFQGWTALTAAGPREGSLLLYPNVKTSIAYMLLRPFFSPPPDEKDVMDATKWTFDISNSWFPGTFREHSQNASPSSHPHLRLRECMVNIPRMRPGDTIWWHADMLHAVEVEHLGVEDASVAYVAATPTTVGNKKYLERQARAFSAGGKVPEDFGGGGDEEGDEAQREENFVGWVGEKGILSEKGRRAAGLV